MAKYGAADDGKPGSRSGLASRFQWRNHPPTLVVHGALVLVFVFFGGGSFVSKFGIRGTSPLLFEFVREAISGPFFLVASKIVNGQCLPDAADFPRVAVVCFCFAVSQASFFVGLKHENPTVGATWQAALPVFTTLFAVACRAETVSWKKVLGVLLASGGAMWMTVGALIHNDELSVQEPRSWVERIDGHLLFCGQAILNSMYIILAKPVVAKYGGSGLSAWMFVGGSCYLLIFLLIVKASWGLSTFACFDASPEIMDSCIYSLFQIPKTMILPLVYEVICCSMIAWFLLTWALNYTLASIVSIYTVIQPVVTCLLSLLVIGIKGTDWSVKFGITVPGLHNILGGVLITTGLWVMFTDEAEARSKEEQALTGADRVIKDP